MRSLESRIVLAAALSLATLATTSCSTYHSRDTAFTAAQKNESSYPADYASRVPSHITTSERTILVDPNVRMTRMAIW
jgi:hypothetical protein